jgi:hypothetical protein
MRLTGYMRRSDELDASQQAQMYRLLCTYFEHVTWQQFTRDLAEKQWVALLTDAASGQVQGFSTLQRLHACAQGRPVVAFFSGDTIIHRDYWGETLLPRLLGQHAFHLSSGSTAPVYWFLICSGYKTYRYLPLLFREFYPTWQWPMPPDVKQVLDTLARHKFGERYDAARGIVRLSGATPLRPGVADLTPHRLQDPHVAFFAAANPGHTQGDELACLAELCPANLTRAGQRLLLRGAGRGSA